MQYCCGAMRQGNFSAGPERKGMSMWVLCALLQGVLVHGWSTGNLKMHVFEHMLIDQIFCVSVGVCSLIMSFGVL